MLTLRFCSYSKNLLPAFSLLFCVIIFTCSATIGQIRKWNKAPMSISTTWADSVSPGNVHPEYPRPQMQRGGRVNWKNLNGLWQYCIADSSSNTPTFSSDSILVPFPLESALSGVKKKLYPDQVLWYRKHFVPPGHNNSERILLHFGAVDWKAIVFVNGVQVGQHEGGYTAFTLDITDALNSGENLLTVKVYDPTDFGFSPHGKQVLNPQSIYYTSTSGIWQTVWLEKVPQIHIQGLKILPDIDNDQVTFTVKAEQGDNFEVLIRDNQRIVARGLGIVGSSLRIHISGAKLWSPETPYLYDIEVRLLKNNAVTDKIRSYFGMRKISIGEDATGVERIFLNNKPYFNFGILDQGFWPEGLYTAPTDAALKFDILAIKQMGFNTIRKHIKVEPARWYYYADKLGMLVWQDFVNPSQSLPEGAKQSFEREIDETVVQLFNSPSIVTWVLFNEKWGQFDQERLTNWVKRVDPSRLINGHSGELLYVNNQLRSPSPNAYISSDIADVHSYPFPRMPQEFAGKAKVVGEFGGIGTLVEGHIWSDLESGWGYDGIVNPDTLVHQYKQLIDSLIILKKNGLSASIYTQPYDVESELNGLITYDRKILKLPMAKLMALNAKLYSPVFKSAKLVHISEYTPSAEGNRSYEDRVTQFQNGRFDSAFLRSLAIMSLQHKDTLLASRIADKYILGLKHPMIDFNLRFIRRFTFSVNDLSFKILFDNIEQVDNVLGRNVAEHSILKVLQDELIDPSIKRGNLNLDSLESVIVGKYGRLAQERIWQARLLYYQSKSDWKNYGKYYKLYFDRVIPAGRNYLHINNMSWPIFENVADTTVLKSALVAMSYSIQRFDSLQPDALDTYANLLYKLGDKERALTWEKKALDISNNRRYIKENYEKMLRGEKTWK